MAHPETTGNIVRRTLEAGAIGAGVLLAAACSETSTSETPVPPETVVEMTDEELAQAIIEEREPCDLLPIDHELIVELNERGKIVVDGECHPYPDDPLGGYSQPRQEGSADALFYTYDIPDVTGTEDGEHIRNDRWGSSTWVKVEDPQSGEEVYIPVAYTQGPNPDEVMYR